tara:strand:- start:1046 stop:1177 length:132 start_codon:yes stop_codon:yes gene_type:complete
LNEAGDGFATINDAVVVSQRKVDHRPDDNLAVNGNPEMIVPTN